MPRAKPFRETGGRRFVRLTGLMKQGENSEGPLGSVLSGLRQSRRSGGAESGLEQVQEWLVGKEKWPISTASPFRSLAAGWRGARGQEERRRVWA